MSKYAAVITTRNEAQTIGDLVRALVVRDCFVIVVDDCSTDATVKNAKLAGTLMVFENERRIGIGPSLVRGWKLALRFEPERVAQVDAGGSHNPDDTLALLHANGDVVIGSRFCRGGKYIGRPWRALASRLAAAMCNLVHPGAHFSDWSSGHRAFSADAIRALRGRVYEATMHGFQLEVIHRALELGLNVTEHHITYCAGKSAFSLGIAKEALQVWLTMALGWHAQAGWKINRSRHPGRVVKL